jgi:uncharacterized coiled-coil protein SlyX
MKTLSKLFTAALLIAITFGCEDSGKAEELSNKITALESSLSEKDDELIELNRIADDYVSQINNLKDELYALEGELGKERTPLYPQKYLDFINAVHGGWEAVISDGSKEKLLSNFLDDYSINGVRFNISGTTNVGQGKEGFEQFLDQLAANKDNIKISVGRYDIGYLGTSGDNFTIALKAEHTAFVNGKKENRAVIEVISGVEQDGQLKIGNYSWVNIPQE